MFDLLIKGGRLVDPAVDKDGLYDVAIDKGRVAAVDAGIPAERAREIIDATGRLVCPGLIDLHTHVYWGGTSLGVDADALALRSGTTTFVDAGSAGAGNFLGFRRHVMEPAKVRILAYLNVSFAGIFGFARNLMVGECCDIRLCDARETVACAREHRDRIVGVKVRVGRIASGSSGAAPMLIAREAADRLQMPLMAHLDFPPPSREEVVNALRPADVLTHCFRPYPNDARDGAGRIRAEILAARQRGVIFDIGHGMGSLDFEVARAMVADGFLPDTISSDVHALCIDGPAFDLLVTMSKFLNLGMALKDVVRAATQTPARAIGAADLGTLKQGAIADACLLEERDGSFEFIDAVGQKLKGGKRLFCHGLVVGGHWWPGADTLHEPSARCSSP
ncbi:MAG: amidohydrolase/deacetylase family metallohydrolase [Methylobacteriaceae bacterium]|nr:amidohydrolase/deacetylase family metallohydrolase [Methylobacteriaceae bacterium]